jgi:hypothetical protein
VPAPPSPPDPVDLVLHIGTGKTGTSSIQYFLDQNRELLADLGLLYPKSPGTRRHTRLGLYIRPDNMLNETLSWHRQRFSSPTAFRRAFRRRLFNEMSEAGLSRLLFSDEALYGSPNQALRRLKRFTDRIARNVRLVVYLRRQDDHMVSRYQQVVKAAEETRTLQQRTRELEMSATYDYYARLRTWARLVQPDELVVRRFERDAFVDGSLHQDFFDAAGIEARADEMKQVEHVNESLDAEAVELLRILNLLRAEDETTASLVPNNHPLVVRLAAASDGPTLTLPNRFLNRFMARWEESNQAVAREHFGDANGQLFRHSRRTANTTTKQHLDPARLDHFLDLLELPEQVHDPLRALVEREAKVRPSGGRRKGKAQGRASGKPVSTNLPAHYDSAARAVIERVRLRTMTQPEKLYGLILATRYIVEHGIQGDIVECGVWRGGSIQAVALTLRESGDITRDLHLYDTFEGMTPPEDVDRRRDGKSAAALLEANDRDSRVWGVATLDDVKTGMGEVDYPPEHVHFHPGRVEDTIPGDAPETIALLRLDTDWYASTKHEFDHLYDRLAPGGVLIIDDYGYWEGSRRATEEFLAKSGAKLLLLPLGDGRIAVKPGL